MPPEQCPECGRFLSRAFVTGARQHPAPCPGCGAPVDMSVVAPPGGVAAANDRGAARVSVATPPPDAPDIDALPADASAAPPPATPAADPPLPTTASPAADAAGASHPLDDWDRDPVPAAGGSGRVVGVPAPVLLAAGGGAALGVLLAGRDHRLLGALLGATAGAVVGWRLD